MTTEYPAKTCDIERLVRHPKLVDAVKAGRKTQQRRDGLYAYPGETFELDGLRFVVSKVERQPLGHMTEEDAIAEGYPSLSAYRDLILKMHAGMTWDESHLVWVHHFHPAESATTAA
ncbi:ASCH domain-containing protein [Methylococcus sp. EFPC2]|uniref:ASCH domain-containing protein n=1 Tax=Methylococcus sp. EFPC2 TaxID=2812648 RepID=UPI001966E339|nr:ASCH domain-containing protein [Methylococcus sp. EFPC2]QSA98452.1 ASCH domain-containing protein [Methylococcus sp. EFPC2]